MGDTAGDDDHQGIALSDVAGNSIGPFYNEIKMAVVNSEFLTVC